MFHPSGTSLELVVFFTKTDASGNIVPNTGRSATIDVYEVDASGNSTQMATGAAMTAVGSGLYRYRHTTTERCRVYGVAYDGDGSSDIPYRPVAPLDAVTVGEAGPTATTTQASDIHAVLTDATYGLSAIETLVDDLEGRLTAARAAYLDMLADASGNNRLAQIQALLPATTVASQADVTGLALPNLDASGNAVPAQERLTALQTAILDDASGNAAALAALVAAVPEDVAAAVLLQPDNRLAVDASGNVSVTGLDDLATAADVTSAADMVLDAISGIGATRGSGADAVTLTLLDADGNPQADADVWITSDAAGNNVVAGTLQTNGAGQATFLLDAGVTYYRWAQKDSVSFVNPAMFTAVAD